MTSALEIACFKPEALTIAQQAGADRIEFCQNYGVGGLTPYAQDIVKARQILRIPLHVMIRPRAGDFVYTSNEQEKMKQSISLCRNAGVDALVFGCLTKEGDVDEEQCSSLLEMAYPLPCCFHRAVDHSSDPDRAVERIVKLGFRYLLSSGAAPDASQGAARLARWHKNYGTQLQLVAGGGIRSSNLAKLQLETACLAFHSSAIRDETNQLPSSDEIRKMKRVLNKRTLT